MRIPFYEPADIPRLANKRKALLLFAAVLAVLLAAAVTALLVRTDARNETRMRYTAEAVAVGLGWAVIGLLMRASACRKYLKHSRVMLATDPEALTGTLGTPGKPLTLTGGIGFRPVSLDTGGLIRQLRVSEKNAYRLPPAGTPVRVSAVHGFITAWEAKDETPV